MKQDIFKKIDTKELELPETLFICNIESRVFQSIALECLSRIEGVAPLEGNIIDSLLGRELLERGKGVHVEQEEKEHSVRIKIEVNIAYGVSLPEKAEEIQSKIASDVSRLTGLRVSCVHVIFKNLISSQESKQPAAK